MYLGAAARALDAHLPHDVNRISRGNAKRCPQDRHLFNYSARGRRGRFLHRDGILGTPESVAIRQRAAENGCPRGACTTSSRSAGHPIFALFTASRLLLRRRHRRHQLRYASIEPEITKIGPWTRPHALSACQLSEPLCCLLCTAYAATLKCLALTPRLIVTLAQIMCGAYGADAAPLDACGDCPRIEDDASVLQRRLGGSIARGAPVSA